MPPEPSVPGAPSVPAALVLDTATGVALGGPLCEAPCGPLDDVLREPPSSLVPESSPNITLAPGVTSEDDTTLTEPGTTLVPPDSPAIPGDTGGLGSVPRGTTAGSVNGRGVSPPDSLPPGVTTAAGSVGTSSPGVTTAEGSVDAIPNGPSSTLNQLFNP